MTINPFDDDNIEDDINDHDDGDDDRMSSTVSAVGSIQSTNPFEVEEEEKEQGMTIVSSTTRESNVNINPFDDDDDDDDDDVEEEEDEEDDKDDLSNDDDASRFTVSSLTPPSSSSPATEAAILRQLQHLNEAMCLKDSAYGDLEYEAEFHLIKNQESTDGLEAKSGATPAGHVQVMLDDKSAQNAALTMQLRTLQELLDQSTQREEHLQEEMNELHRRLKDHAVDHHGSRRKLMVQLHSLQRTLQSQVHVDEAIIPWEWRAATPDATMQIAPASLDLLGVSIHHRHETEKDNNDDDDGDGQRAMHVITRTTIAMEADRRRLQQELNDIKVDNQLQEERIRALTRHIRDLEAKHATLQQSNGQLRATLNHKDDKIGALEELFANINTNRTVNAGIGNLMIDYKDDDYSLEADDLEDVEIDSVQEGATETVLSRHHHPSSASTVQSSTSHRSTTLSLARQTESEVQEAEMELVVLQDRYQLEQRDHETAKNLIACLEDELLHQKREANSAKQKAEHRATLLKDVIRQYKELQVDHDDSLEELHVLKNRIESFKEYHHTLELELKEYRRQQSKPTSSKSSNNMCKSTMQNLSRSKQNQLQEDEEDDVSAFTADMTEPTVSSPEEQDFLSSTGPIMDGAEKEKLEKEVKSLESDCDRLQHEFDTAMVKVANLEEEVSAMQDQLEESNLKIAELQSAKSRVEQERHFLEVKAEQELHQAQQQSQDAMDKKKQREQDLWQVIELYKQLAEQKEGLAEDYEFTKAQIETVAEELKLTKKVKTKGRDMVYEFRKLERDVEKATMLAEDLQQKLQQAKADAAKSREEAESARQVMTSTKVKYDQVQQQLKDLVNENKTLQRSLHVEVAERRGLEQLRRSWLPIQKKMEELAAQQDQSERELQRLQQENAELHSCCNDFLKLACKSVEAL